MSAQSDPSGQHGGHFGDPQTSQKREADQINFSSWPDGNELGYKRMKQEPSCENQRVVNSNSPNDKVTELSTRNGLNGHSMAAKPNINSMEYPTNVHDYAMYPHHSMPPVERSQAITQPMLGIYPFPKDTSPLRIIHVHTLEVMKAQIQHLEDQSLEYEKMVKRSVDPAEKEKFSILNNKNEELQKNIKTLRDQNQELLEQMQEMQSSKPQSTPDEQHISDLWKSLRLAIYSLANLKFHGHPMKRSIKNDHDFFGILTPVFDEYLTNGSKKYLIQAGIWRKLVDNFLHSPSLVYQITIGRASQTVDRKIKEPSVSREMILPQYYEWKTQTGQFLHMLYGDKGAYVTKGDRQIELANEMVQMFSRYTSSVDTTSLYADFEDIIEKAVALARLMARSESRYVASYTKANESGSFLGQRVDEAWMEVVAQDCNKEDEQPVELVVSPALFKFFLHPETKTESHKVLSKAQVVT